MATMAAEPAFVDTNVLVYATRTKSHFHPRATACLWQARNDGTPLWFSRQIIREYLAVVTRPQATEPALPIAKARADVEGFLADFNVAEDGSEVIPAAGDSDVLPFNQRHGPACPGHRATHTAAIGGPDEPGHDGLRGESNPRASGITRVLIQLLAQVPSGGRQVHDVNIVATMLAQGITRLLTFNEADFRRFASVIDIAVP
jgi:predicted nucleic acid-binding protein